MIMNKFYLIKDDYVNLQSDYSHSVDFANLEQQTLFWLNAVKWSTDTIKFLRGQSNTIVVNKPFEFVKGFSYCAFKNLYGNDEKMYYCFIDDIVYNTPETTYITFTIDDIQTYMFDYEISDSFIEREHKHRCEVSNIDGVHYLHPIFNTTTEHIDIGREYKIYNKINTNQTALQYSHKPNGGLPPTVYEIDVDIFYFYIRSKNPLTDDSNKNPTTFKHLSTNIYYYCVPVSQNFNIQYENFETQPLPETALRVISDNPNIIDINVSRVSPTFMKQSIYKTIDKKTIFIDTKDINKATFATVNMSEFGLSNYPILQLLSFDIDTINLKLPTIKHGPPFLNSGFNYRKFAPSMFFETKLFTYPYYFLEIDNTNKVQVLYEHIKSRLSNTHSVKITTSLDIDDFVIVNKNGKNDIGNIQTLDTPQLNLRTNAWLNYESTHKATLESGLKTQRKIAALGAVGGAAVAAVGVGATLATGGAALPLLATGATALLGTGVGFGVSQYGKLQNQMILHQDIKNTPDDVSLSSTNLSNILYRNMVSESFEQTFSSITTIEKCITDEHRQNIFNYFMRFGYKSNSFGVPNLRSRYYYNFIKTTIVNFKTQLPAVVQNNLERIYNNGITFWHYRNDKNEWLYLDYSKENIESFYENYYEGD